MTDLDQLTAEDPVVRQLARIMRDGQPSTLEEAVAELSQLVDPVRVQAAAARIRELNDLIQQAQTPTNVVAGNIESWYPGPREEDRNWSALVEILQSEGWDGEMLHDLDESSTKVVANLPNPRAKASTTAAVSSWAMSRAARRRTSPRSSRRPPTPATGSSSCSRAFTTLSASRLRTVSTSSFGSLIRNCGIA